MPLHDAEGFTLNTFYVKASPPWTAGGGRRLPIVVGRAVPASRCGGVQVCGAVRAGRYAVCAEPCAGCFVPDRAFIRAEMCSREFPRQKPLDLSGLITYRAAPDTEHIQLRIDTVSRSDGFWMRAGRYAIGAVAGGMAASAAALFLKH